MQLYNDIMLDTVGKNDRRGKFYGPAPEIVSPAGGGLLTGAPELPLRSQQQKFLQVSSKPVLLKPANSRSGT